LRIDATKSASTRNKEPVRFTDFASGVTYMEFTEAVARSAQRGVVVELPLEVELEE
jgi:hypothetical protein